MRLKPDDLRDMIRREIELILKAKRKDEHNPYHAMAGEPDGGRFTSKDDNGSWSSGGKKFKYRSGKKQSSSAPCGRGVTRKRTCSKGVITSGRDAE